ncbi:hypothetical protein D9Q98_001555 [Chlorella vulgaris]|uniref:Uncharacterized protein n=1 Tax=Chlorella vulgaris TaxID=3077 RepID=A0A9D4TUM9_CHLVU|nr:hypothetical protein D9Q98_001555 [Chlorella vulgaris]
MVARRVIETVSAQPTLEESKFTRALGSSDFHTREAGLAALRSWLTRKRDVDELDLLKLWKGIFYCFWHSDKADVQLALAERLAELMNQLPEEVGWMYYVTFLRTMRREWAGIDRLRLDKFMMLMRCVFRSSLRLLQALAWPQERIQRLAHCWLHDVLLPGDTLAAAGVAYHLVDLMLPELEACVVYTGANGAVAMDHTLRPLLEPFCAALAATSSPALVVRLRQSLFDPMVEEVRLDRDAAALEQLDAAALATHLFDLGAQEGVRARNREALYAVSAALDKAAAQRRPTRPVRQEPEWDPLPPPPRKARISRKLTRKRQADRKQQKQQQAAGPGDVTLQLAAPLQLQPPAGAPASQLEAGPASPPSEKKRKRRHGSTEQQAPAEPAQAADSAPLPPQSNGTAAAAAGAAGQVEPPEVRWRSHTLQELLAGAVAAVEARRAAAAQAKQDEGTPGGGSDRSGRKKNRVRFSLRRNLVNVIGAEPKPADVRTPPSAKPKGSALKRMSAFGAPASAPERRLTRAGRDRQAQFESDMELGAGAQPAAGSAPPGTTSASKTTAGSRSSKKQKRRASLPTPATFSRPRATDFF